MLTAIDRIIIAAREQNPVVRALNAVLGAEVVGTGPVPVWAAERTTLRAGLGEIEVLSPKGVGAVANFIGRRGPGIFALGFATANLDQFRSHLEAQAVFFDENAGQLFVTSDKGVDLPGLNLLITPARTRTSIGLLQRFCGATLLHRLADSGSLLRILGAHSSQLSRVDQTVHGFSGNVIRLGDDLGSHLAILVPSGTDTPIGRFFYQRGPGIYLASAMTEQPTVIRERLASLRHVAPAPSMDGSLLIPPHLLGGARLALFTGTAARGACDVSLPILASDPAWA